MDSLRIEPWPWPRGLGGDEAVAGAIAALGLGPEDCFGFWPAERNSRELLVAYRPGAGRAPPGPLRVRSVAGSLQEALGTLAPEDVFGFIPLRWARDGWRELVLVHRDATAAPRGARVDAWPWPRGPRMRARREDVERCARDLLSGLAPERCLGLGPDAAHQRLLVAHTS